MNPAERTVLFWPRFGRLGLLALALGLSFPGRAHGFALGTVVSGGKPMHYRWQDSALPVRFKLNNRTLDLLPNLASTSNLQAAVEESMRSWATGPVAFTLTGTTPILSAAADQVNLITFANTAANRDMVGNNWAVTPTWTVQKGGRLWLSETDVVMSPKSRYATNGAPDAGDIQDALTHELGHALGLSHSPIFSATMYPAGSPGQTSGRSLDPDDLAGIHQLYNIEEDTQLGSIEGEVIIDESTPVFGAHVVAVDASGIVRVGALTDRAGGYALPSLPPGDYRVYAEPLDEPVTGSLVDDYYRSARRNFRTAFVGAGVTFSPTHVPAGQTVVLDPIRVENKPPTLNLKGFWWSNERDTDDWHGWPAPIHPGRALYAFVTGTGLDKVPVGGFSVSGADIAVDNNLSEWLDCSDGTACNILTLWVGPRARPGARSLYATNGSERVALTGVIEVPAP